MSREKLLLESSPLEAVGSGYGVLEKGNPGRQEGNHGKQDQQQHNHPRRGFVGNPAGLSLGENPGFNQKARPHGQEKDGNVKPHPMLSQGAGIQVVDCGNQQQGRQKPFELGAPEPADFLADAAVFHQGKHRHGPQHQFHMLPDGFVHRGNQGHQPALSAPFKEKMQQGAHHRHEEKSRNLPMGQGLFYGNHLQYSVTQK